MNNFYPQQTKVITKQSSSSFSFALKVLGIFLLFMGGSGVVAKLIPLGGNSYSEKYMF